MPSYGGNYTGLGLDMAVGSHLRHYKQLQQRMDARKTKAESITLRKDWLRAQKRANYQNESTASAASSPRPSSQTAPSAWRTAKKSSRA